MKIKYITFLKIKKKGKQKGKKMVIKPEWYELNKTIVINKKFHNLS